MITVTICAAHIAPLMNGQDYGFRRRNVNRVIHFRSSATVPSCVRNVNRDRMKAIATAFEATGK